MTKNGLPISRRDVLRAGLSTGAALGVGGLAGLTVVGGAAADQRQAWEDLPQGQNAPATNLQLRTIGLGVSVQDRFLMSSSAAPGTGTGKVTTLTAMITEWLAGGYQNYDTNETNANRNAALWDTGLLQPIPVEKVIPWKYARDPTPATSPGLRRRQRLAAQRGLGRSEDAERVQAGAAVLQLRLHRLSLRSHRRGHHQLGRAP